MCHILTIHRATTPPDTPPSPPLNLSQSPPDLQPVAPDLQTIAPDFQLVASDLQPIAPVHHSDPILVPVTALPSPYVLSSPETPSVSIPPSLGLPSVFSTTPPTQIAPSDPTTPPLALSPPPPDFTPPPAELLGSDDEEQENPSDYCKGTVNNTAVIVFFFFFSFKNNMVSIRVGNLDVFQTNFFHTWKTARAENISDGLQKLSC